jgi:hypothetical protein
MMNYRIRDEVMSYDCPEDIKTPKEAVEWLLDGYDYGEMEIGDSFFIQVWNEKDCVLSVCHIRTEGKHE